MPSSRAIQALVAMSSGYKRQRSNAAARILPGPRVPWAAAAGKRRFHRVRVMPGFTRQGGYYGRYPGELKFFDVDLDDAVVATGGTITDSINKIAQGVTEVQRVGRKCTLTHFNWRVNYTLPVSDAVATAAAGDVLRMMVFIDKQANGATATVTNILESADYQSFLNLANIGRFQILCDKTVSLSYQGLASDGAGVVSSSPVIRHWAAYKKIKVPVEFDGATGAITEIRSNNLGVLLISKNGLCGFVSKIRLRYSDGS